MPEKPAAAFGSNLVQILGAIILISGVVSLPSAGGVIAIILGALLVAAATKRWLHTSRD